VTTVAVPKEIVPGERRVALTPEVVARLVKAGLRVRVERGAGAGAHAPDADYEAAGAEIVAEPEPLWREADVVLKVQPPTRHEAHGAHETDWLREGACLIGFLRPAENAELLERLRARRATALAMELIPRISRAQKMDALSSQATAAGYRAALVAAESLPRFFPMLTTAAGTIPPARVFVIGAGVAGLQAIATCRRLGAVVHAFDIRPAVKEQVESLGAQFVGAELLTAEAETGGGYAKEVDEETRRREQALIAQQVKAADVVITTALVPGKRAPLLITEEMVRAMKPGSVIVDLAAEAGGNCACTRPGETVTLAGVTIRGETNLPATLAVHASQMYARNISSVLLLLWKDGTLRFDFDDPIVAESCVTHAGELRYGRAPAQT
jgi:NAD(P) transhydrogenase subunit alpha